MTTVLIDGDAIVHAGERLAEAGGESLPARFPDDVEGWLARERSRGVGASP